MNRAIKFRGMLVVSLLSVGWLSMPGFAAEQDDTIYRTLVDAAKAGDKSVDYRLMRLACMKSSLCQPRSSKAELQALTDAEKDPGKQAGIAEKLVDEGFVNIEAHGAAAGAYRQMGQSEKANFHLSMVAALVQSIRKSGDGKTRETAFEVICDREEYDVLTYLNLPYNGSGVVSTTPLSADGKKYERWEVRDPKGGQNRLVYFNIDAFMDAKSHPR